VAHDGPQGIDRARQLRPEVVLCDIGLPGMDGYAVAKALRGEPDLRNTVLVALTGYALPEDQRRAAEAGFEAHLTKPATVEGLEEVMRRARPGPPPGGGAAP
jgi:two-component system CheB/CheR fusion protein